MKNFYNNSNNLEKLMKITGYKFKQLELLVLALTHRSAHSQNNERLEFLGDAILNFVIAQKLFDKFPRAHEGELSRLRSGLVNQETLAAIAQEFELGQYLHVGPGELKSGGIRRKSILSDTLEAIIGAVYLDTGLSACQEMVLGWFALRLENIDSHKIEGLKDPKSKLQEYLQARKKSLPVYTVLKITGEPHTQIFEVSCEVPGLSYTTFGCASARREAEQIAAADFLTWLNLNAYTKVV